MKAITLIQPWAWAIANAGKDVENRSWRPTGILGQRFAIHAGKRVDLDGILEIARAGINVPRVHVKSAVVAVATLAGVICIDSLDDTPDHLSYFAASKWFTGGYGWCLRDVVALPRPVPCRGAQGLWTLPADVEAAVKEQLR